MIIDSGKGDRGILIDEGTCQRVPFACWANLATGEYEALACTADGRRVIEPKRKYRGRAVRLRWVPAAPVRTAARPETPDDGRPENRGRRVLAVPGRECEEKGCHALAEYATGDEQELLPATMSDGRLAQRAELTRSHFFCRKHYRLPVHTSLRGVESEVSVKARPD